MYFTVFYKPSSFKPASYTSSSYVPEIYNASNFEMMKKMRKYESRGYKKAPAKSYGYEEKEDAY